MTAPGIRASYFNLPGFNFNPPFNNPPFFKAPPFINIPPNIRFMFLDKSLPEDQGEDELDEGLDQLLEEDEEEEGLELLESENQEAFLDEGGEFVYRLGAEMDEGFAKI